MNSSKWICAMAVLAASLTLALGCQEKESDVGLGLEDPSTLYEGNHDTIYLTGKTFFDDSLITSGYRIGMIGRCEDPTCGTTWARFYTQVALPNDGGINVSSSAEVDSAILTLKLSEIFSFSNPGGSGYNMHFKIHQLVRALDDSIYYASSTQAMDFSKCFLDTTITVSPDATSIQLPLRSNIYPLLKTTATSEQFLETMKGICIEMNSNDGPAAMIAVNLDAVDTKLTVYCSDSTATVSYNFLIGYGTTHYVNFLHKYSGTDLVTFDDNKKDSIDGANWLYLQPMGGTRVEFRLDPLWFAKFRAEHPTAVIHYAELKLPVTNGDTNTLASRLQAFHTSATGYHSLVLDASDPVRYAGLDGYYSNDKKCYRMLLTRHLQNLLRSGKDYGTLMTIESRRSSARSCKLNGYTAAEKPRIEIIYSE